MNRPFFGTISDIEVFLASLPVLKTTAEEKQLAVRDALALIGNPQLQAPAIHIAGTS